jgi:hypothetical protein
VSLRGSGVGGLYIRVEALDHGNHRQSFRMPEDCCTSQLPYLLTRPLKFFCNVMVVSTVQSAKSDRQVASANICDVRR